MSNAAPAHALLSPSGASRWLACTPSAKLELQFPDNSGDAADEGTLAHKLGELVLRLKLKLITKQAFGKALNDVHSNRHFEASMREYMDGYAAFVLEKFAEAKAITPDAKLFLEQKLDLTDWIPEGFGTGDCGIVADRILHCIDLKYGKGVKVSVDGNKQMMLYALGFLAEMSMLYDIDTVRMTIYQPRRDNISTCEVSVDELYAWAENELKPLAALAFKGEGEYVSGDHCGFCRAAPVCKAYAERSLQLAKYDFRIEPLLTDDEVVDIISKAKQFTKWLKTVTRFALVQAINHGKTWPGYKLVEGKSNRRFSDLDGAAQILAELGLSEDAIFKPKEMIALGKIEKAVGKKTFGEKLAPYVVKPTGRPTLAPESDKRPAMSSAAAAAVDFAQDEDDEE